MNNIERVKIVEPVLTAIPNNLYIDLDGTDNIIVRINNNEIKVDKNKLETLLRTLAKEDVYGL